MVVLEEVIELKAKCFYCKEPISPEGGGGCITSFGRGAACWAEMLTVSSWREIFLILRLHPHNALLHNCDALLIENRPKQWNFEQIPRHDWDWAQIWQEEKICEYGSRLLRRVPRNISVLSLKWDLQEPYGLTRHFNYSWWQLKLHLWMPTRLKASQPDLKSALKSFEVNKIQHVSVYKHVCRLQAEVAYNEFGRVTKQWQNSWFMQS